MNQLELFENTEFGNIRGATINGEPWVIGKDVASILGYENPTKAIRVHVDPEDKKMGVQNGAPSITDRLGRVQYPTYINESGVYALIFGSKMKKAKEFKRWVTSEVLPSLRKHGGYILDQDQMTDEELLASAFLVSRRIAKERALRIEELEAKTKAQAEQLAIAEPKVEYYDAFVHAKTSSNFRTTAKEIGVGERKLIKLLLDKRFLYRDQQGDLLPYAEKNRDYFIVREVAGNHWMGKQTYITEKGKQHFRKLCMKAGLVKGEMDTALPMLPAQS